MKKFLIGALSVVAALFIVFYIAYFIKYGIGYSVIIPIASAVLCLMASLILKSAAKKGKNKPKYNASQLEDLKKAAKEDRLTKTENDKNEALAKEEYDKNLPLAVNETKRCLDAKVEELHTLAEKLKSHLAAFNSMDYLSQNDKTLQTIDCLIYFIETRRADSIKEALHEYDKMLSANQLAALEQQRIDMLNRQIKLQQQQLEMQEANNKEILSTIKNAAAEASRERALQRDMMYVHCMNIENSLGSVAHNSRKLADNAELYLSSHY